MAGRHRLNIQARVIKEIESNSSVLKKILSASSDPVLITDKKVRIVYVNQAWKRLTRYTLKEVVGKNPNILKTDKTPKRVYKEMWQALRSGKSYTTEELINRRKDNLEYQIYSTIFPIMQDHTPLFYVQVEHDITERKKHEETQYRYELLFNSSNDAVIVLSPDEIIQEWNPAAVRLYGYQANEAAGSPLSILIPPERRNEDKKFKEQALKAGTSHFETEHLTKSSRTVKVSLTISPIWGHQKRLLGYSVFARDITKQKELEELKKEFLSMAAHELRTPVTTLKLLSQMHLLKYQRFGAEKIELHELKLIDKELDRLNRLISDILDDRRIESGKLNLRLEIFDINSLAADAVEETKPALNGHTLKFIPTDKIEVMGDSQRTKQVLVNLLTNAAKYSKPNTTITVAIKRRSSAALVSVKDQGRGIPKSKLKLIFDRFYQVKEHSSSGFGLGLYISKQIVEAQRGKIWLKSKVNEGSIFYFTIPTPLMT